MLTYKATLEIWKIKNTAFKSILKNSGKLGNSEISNTSWNQCWKKYVLKPKTKGLMTLGRLDIPGEFDNLHIIFILS